MTNIQKTEKGKRTTGNRNKCTVEETLPHYVVSESFPLLLSEGLTEALDELVQFLSVMAQEVSDILQALQAVGGRWAELRQAWVRFHGSGDAQDVVALLLVIVEGFVEEDGDRCWGWEAR